MKSVFVQFALFAFAVAAAAGEQCSTYPCLVFEDNFDTLNFSKWEHEISAWGGGNFEFQYYRNNRRNSFTRNGTLHIQPTLTEDQYGEDFIRHGTLDLWGANPANLCTGHQYGGCYQVGAGNKIVAPVASARLRTVRAFAYRYGRIEVEAKMPTGDWLWPAIWLLPEDNEYGDWPASGEIDLVESRGNRNITGPDGKSSGVDEMGMTLHFGPVRPLNGWEKAHASRRLNDGTTFGTKFHKYRLDWSEDKGFEYYLDDEHIMTVNPPEGFWKLAEDHWTLNGKKLDEQTWSPWLLEKGGSRMAPFDKPFYIIMNVAVGGTAYFPDFLKNQPYEKPWKNNDEYPMTNFYNGKHLWYPTWTPRTPEESSALQVNYVRVWKLKAD